MSLLIRPHLFHSILRDFDRLDRATLPYWLDSGDNLRIAETTQNVVNDEKMFAMEMDVSHFKPEELKVSLDGRILTVEGSQESKDDDNYMKRSFVRKWTLPEDVDLVAVRSSLSDKGLLVIEAPKSAAAATRTIPIQFK